MLKRDVLSRDGFSEEEIDKIDIYCKARYEAGQFDNTATPIISGGEMKLVCATVAEAIRLVRNQQVAPDQGNLRNTRPKKKPTCPNFDALAGKPMVVPFIFRDGNVGTLEGKCRGFGAITGTTKRYEETIGVYTTEGDYHNIKIDLRVTCAAPTFMIGDTSFYFPVVECSTVNYKVDPSTGNLIVPESQ